MRLPFMQPPTEPCAACRKPLLQGSIITLNGATYHAACFCCTACRSSLLPADNKTGGVHMNGGKPFCGKCWTDKFAERCSACRQPFSSRQQVVLFDGHKLHPHCFKCSGTCGQPIGSAKFMRQGDKAYCTACHTAAFSPKCGVCKQPIEGGSRFIVHKGRKLHPSCFSCVECGVALGGNGNAGSGAAEHYERDGAVYCADDYRRRFGEECAICRARLLSWIVTDAGDTYCQKHEKDSPPCHGCGKLVAPNSGGTDLSDGRVSCKECSRTAVHSQSHAYRLLNEVRTFLNSRGLHNLPENADLNLELLERSELLARNGCGGSHTTGRQPTYISSHRQVQCPLGLTQAEETTTVLSGSGRITSRSRTVRAVCLLKGLPEEIFVSTLAHELGHVFLHLSDGFDSMATMPAPLAEGICELLAYLWLSEGRGSEPHAAAAAAAGPPGGRPLAQAAAGQAMPGGQ